MMRWGWLTVILVPTLLAGCSLIKNLSPYAERPTCSPAGALPERKLTQEEMKRMELLTDECFYTLEITDIDPAQGRATGKLPLSEVEKMKIDHDGIDYWGVRRNLPVQNYPRFQYNFQIEGGTGNLKKGDVAHFIRKPDSSMLSFYTPEQWCAEKEKRIKADFKRYKDAYKIPPEFIKECENLAKLNQK